ncbi:dnaJ homolog subfamily A member 3, mitochondrial-like [Uranotaenia lowii]|uniref:dnaJ homolog subfamily A member 3, mitochondrial-like n=1 Tax=Uranotaenia lowii TaxID=190385 RepID=UPI00247A776B|nr:dnaJ homolog subfamily A member 3, mitochondrial-like [Uranotaenia lowii]
MIDKFKLGSGLMRIIGRATTPPAKPKFRYIPARSDITQPVKTHDQKPVEQKDYYSVLGVSHMSSFQDIKQAYYKLAKEYHPDMIHRTDGDSGVEKTAIHISDADEAKFQEITEAYEALMSEYKKCDSLVPLNPELYKTVTQVRRKSIASAWNTVNELNYEDVILKISFKEATEGSRREIKLPIGSKCENCSAWGSFPPVDSEGLCKVCQGSGKQTIQTESGPLHMVCRFCKGARVSTHQHICNRCNGKGIVLKPCPVQVLIPKGSKNRDVLKARIPGHKRTVNVILNVHDIDRFKREGINIRSTEEITLTEAVLGANIPVKGIDGTFNVHVPPGTQPGTEIRVPAKGLFDLSSQEKGYHLIRIKINIPTHISASQRKLLQELHGTLNRPNDRQ